VDATTRVFSSHTLVTRKGAKLMWDSIWEFLTSWTFLIICIVLLVVLIGVFIFLRMRKTDDQ
jgi:hypothetical protein